MKFRPKQCRQCRSEFTPDGGRQLDCPECKRPRCAQCCQRFIRAQARQRRCDSCRPFPLYSLIRPNDSEAGCFECGSVVSGASYWGELWGGECDRAEKRAAELIARLPATSKGPL